MARAKGLGPWRIMWTYAGRNAILPNLTGFAMSLGFVVARRDPRRVRLQLPGRRLDVPAVGREPGLRPHAGALPADRRRGADGDPRRRRGDGDARSPHPGRADERLVGRSDRPARDAAGRPCADGRGGAAGPAGRPLARDQPQPESGRRRRPDARLRRGLDLPGPDRALRPDGEEVPAGARRVLATPARHDGLRGGHLLSARVGNPGLARDRAGRRGARHGPRRPRRRLGGISRRSHRRVPLPRHRRDSRAADLPAHHRDRGLREERRLPHPRRRARSARLVVRCQAAPLADAVAAEARLPRVGARARRAEVVRDPVRDPADDDVAHRGDVPRGRALRGAHRGRPAVHRARRPEQPELGDDALLGAEQRGALRRHAAVGASLRASASRCSVRPSRSSTTRSTRSAARRCACGSSNERGSPRPSRRRPRARGRRRPACAEGRGPHRRVRDRQRAGRRRRPRRLRACPRRVPRDRRRVWLREVDAALRDRAAARLAATGRDRRRPRSLPGPRPGPARGARAAPPPLARPLGRDAERDERAQPRADRRRSDARCLRGPLEHVQEGDPRTARARCCGSSPSTPSICTAIRISSRAGCGSAR